MTTEQVQQIPRLPESVNFPQNEEDILVLWTKLDVFQTCLKQSKNKPKYSFYDGPPFATGLPHYGHILAGTIKDTVTRYAHQQGFHVARRFGWDCHGLPIEFEIDKALGIKGPEDVMRMGIRAYNDECRKIVTRYVNEWEVIMGRIGRWIDFKNDYKTMYPWFMESVWWVFSQLYEKGMVYQGNKVMPYSTACSTPLSNFESGQNYKDVVDPAVTVTLPLLDDSDGCCLLIWTTTPWTLPSNLAACVHPTLEYVRVKQLSTGKYYVVMAARIDAVFKPGDYEILMKFPGANLKGLEYTPIFDYFVDVMKSQGAYRVVVDEYVTSESGTGIVHQAAYFGEDDYRVCLANDIITKDQDPICPIDASGRLTAPVRDFEGQYIKDADKNIIAHLKNAGRLFHHAQVKHSYPYCWRSDTPLIYRAVPSWFIRVEHMTSQLLSANSASYWVPDFVKEKRFGNWLRDARDWAVSRNRYWGTPIPIWASGDEFRCVGSIAELERLTGKKIADLHRENIDDLEIPSQIPGNPPLRRISEVFDCWFESGSMPYAQQHYPFENKREFDDVFPADFIAEGIDQTRGWFYTLLVISTALYGRAPFKNLIANGLVLAGDGQKMSKRKKNYPDPMVVVGKYGADALRLYLISSPVVRAENLRFKEEGVRDIIKDVFLPWYNAFRFLMQNLESYVDTYKVGFHYCEADLYTENIMDRWILSFTQSLLEYVRKEMALYHLYNVVPRLTKYIDYLTNWYVRMNRKRFKGAAGPADCRQALLTLFNVLYAIIRMMAPFAPFLAEFMYQYIKTLTEQSPPPDSVHYLMLPEPNLAQIDTGIERSVSRLQTVIDLSRVLRDRNTLPVKIPLPEVVVIHQDAAYLKDIIALRHYVLSELNVRELTTTVDKSRYGVTMRAEPDFKTLGVRLKNDFKAVTHAIKALSDSEINATVKRGYVEVCGHRIALNELRLIFKADTVKTDSQYHVESDGDVLVLLNAKPDDRMIDEGTAREVINRVQKLRKKAKLVPTDKIIIRCETDGDVKRVCEDFHEFIETTLRAPFFLSPPVPKTETVILGEIQNLKESLITVRLCAVRTLKAAPICFWANVELLEDISPQYCDGSRKGTILLEKFQSGVGLLSYDELHQYIGALFGVSREFNLYFGDGVLVTLDNYKMSNGRVIYVTSKSQLAEGNFELSTSDPYCKFYNDEKSLTTWLLENPIGVPTSSLL